MVTTRKMCKNRKSVRERKGKFKNPVMRNAVVRLQRIDVPSFVVKNKEQATPNKCVHNVDGPADNISITSSENNCNNNNSDPMVLRIKIREQFQKCVNNIKKNRLKLEISEGETNDGDEDLKINRQSRGKSRTKRLKFEDSKEKSEGCKKDRKIKRQRQRCVRRNGKKQSKDDIKEDQSESSEEDGTGSEDDYAGDFGMGRNELEYTLLRRAVEGQKSPHQYNLRRSTSAVDKIEFKYDLLRCARKSYTGELINEMAEEIEKNLDCELGTKGKKNYRKKDKKNGGAISKSGGNKKVKKNGLDDKHVPSYCITVSVVGNKVYIHHCKTLKNGSVSVNIVEDVLGDYKDGSKIDEENKSNEISQDSEKTDFSCNRLEKKFYYKNYVEELPNGKRRNRIKIYENPFEDSATNELEELLKVHDEINQSLNENFEIDKLDDIYNELEDLLKKGETDLGLHDQLPVNPIPIEDGMVDFPTDYNGIIETFDLNGINNNNNYNEDFLNLTPINSCDLNLNLNLNKDTCIEKIKKILQDLANCNDYAKKNEAYELFNKLMSYK